jgi:uncharacterized membrane protein
LDTGFDQIRHYAAGDLPVSLRMMRVLHDAAATTRDPAIRSLMRARADRVVEGCRDRLDAAGLKRLQGRLEEMHRELG